MDRSHAPASLPFNRPYYGLYVCPMIWRELDNFSSDSVCMVLVSSHYDEGDYFRDYNEYLAAQGLSLSGEGVRLRGEALR